MKIAFFTETYLPNIDGVVTAILQFRKELERRGHKVFIFAAGDLKTMRKNKDRDVHYYLAVPFYPYPNYKLALLPYTAESVIRKEKMDIIHSHGMGGMGMAALYCSILNGLPLVGTLHTNIQEATHYVVPSRTAQGFAKQIAWRYLRFYYNRCDAVTVPSQTMARLCISNGIRNVWVLPNGIDLKKFRPGRKAHRGKIALYVGRLVKEKNLDVMIKSALLVSERVRDIHYVIVGTGPAEKYYKDIVKREGVGHLFTFTGALPSEEVIGWYNKADVFVFPSVFETQGISAIEAMACGVPVAGANYLAIPDIVKEGYNGHLFDPHHVDGCAKAIIRTLDERNKLRRGALATAKKFSIQRCTDQLLKLYGKLMRSRRR